MQFHCVLIDARSGRYLFLNEFPKLLCLHFDCGHIEILVFLTQRLDFIKVYECLFLGLPNFIIIVSASFGEYPAFFHAIFRHDKRPQNHISLLCMTVMNRKNQSFRFHCVSFDGN